MSLQISCWLAAVCVVAHVVGMPQDTDNRAGLERPSTSAPPEVNECGLDSLISDVFGGNPNCNNGGNQPPTDGGYQPPPDGGYQPPPGSGGNQPPPDGGYQPPPGSGGNQPPPDGGYQPPTNGGDGCECVPFYQCSDNNTIIEDGYGLIDIRLKDECGAYDQKCCYPANINPIKPPPRPPVPTDNKCGTRHFDGVGVRITGAEDNEAQYGEFPWMVALVQPHPTKVQDGQPVFVYQCGGSLIHPQVVLTGAHCVRGKNKLVVRAGEWDTQTKNELYPTQDRNVRDVIIHEQFNNNTLVNDPALLILESPVDLSYENIGLVCLPEENENMDGRNCVASGWGKDQFGKEGKYQVILKKVELPIVPKQPCVEALRKTRLGPRFQLHSSFICAGGIPGKDTCKGDGGSPLACPSKTNPEVYVQAGIVAWGISCNTEAPGVYVNVPSFVSWIYNKLQQHGISLDDTCGNTNCKKSESDLVTGNNEPSTNSHGSNNEPSTNSHGSNIDQSNINGGSNYVSNSGNDGSSSYTNNNNPSSDNKPIKPDTNSNVGSYDVTAGNNNDGNHKPPSDSNNGFDPKNPTVNDNDSGAKPAENNGGVQNLPGQTDNSVYNPVPGEANNANSNDCTCVPFYLCNDNSSVSEDGVGLLDIRLKDECGAYDLKCCKITEVKSNNTLYISTTPSTGVPYKKKCGTYNKKGVGVHIIGTKDNEAQYGEFPWMVALVQPHPTKVQDGHPVFVYQCGGSLIHPQVVLTGAHCVKDKSNLVVRAGEWDTQTKNELYPTQDRNVRDVIIHEQFNNNTLVNDPALLILETPVDLSYENIGLVCLPEENENMDRRNCVASGWGKDQFGKKGKYQVILKKVDLPVVPRERCLELLRSTRLGSHFQLHSSLICAGGVPGKDTCQGDGGSPLACPSKTNPEVYVQAGIVGWGIGCNTEIPGVYVNVPAFVPWIHNKLQEHGITL